jgi:hypothetical protein
LLKIGNRELRELLVVNAGERLVELGRVLGTDVVAKNLGWVVGATSSVHADRTRHQNITPRSLKSAFEVNAAKLLVGAFGDELAQTALHLVDGTEDRMQFRGQPQPQ